MTTPRHGLFNAPPDVIHEISYFISGIEALLLWMTGCKRLMYTMSDLGGLRRLCLSTRGFSHLSRFPQVISAFKSLEELKLEFGVQNIVGGSASRAFASWPKTIRKLTLSFRDAEKCWGQITASECFPNLEELDLDGWTGFKAAFVAYMPPNFSSLTLRTNTSSFITNLIKALPRDFKNLTLITNPNIDREALESLPPTLKTLCIPASPLLAQNAELLPSTLTKLDVRVEANAIAGLMSKLPPNLISFVLSTGWMPGANFHLDASKLPASLETLQISGTSRLAMTLKDLPSSLTFLQLSSPCIKASTYENLPSHLRHLIIIDADWDVLCDSFIEALPRSLLTLQVSCAMSLFRSKTPHLTEKAIPHLPPNLTNLVLHPSTNVTGEYFGQLPHFLSLLELRTTSFVLDEHIQHLPKYLQVLRLPDAKDLTDKFAPALPRGLSELIVVNNDSFTFECVPHLPPYINTLELGHTGVKDRYRSERDKKSKKF